MYNKLLQSYFFSQPHQPFFLLAIFYALNAMLLFALQYKGVIVLHVDTLTYHSYGMVFLLFFNAFIGFLFTTFPRFNQTKPLHNSFYTKIFFLNLFGGLLFLYGAFWSTYLTFGAMSILFFTQIMAVKKLHAVYKEGAAVDKKDSFWILFASVFGIVGNALFLLSIVVPSVLEPAINISLYLFLVLLGFSVAQRMVPFFSHSFAQKPPKFVRNVFTLFFLLVLFKSFHLLMLTLSLELILSIYLAREFLRWGLKPLQSPAILWVLHLALAWLPLALFLSALAHLSELLLDTNFYYLDVHMLALGFMTTILIGFGTRVILGHSGQAPQADRFAVAIFLLVQFTLLARALYSFNAAFGWGANFIFDISFTLWLLLFGLWGGRYARTLLFGKKNL